MRSAPDGSTVPRRGRLGDHEQRWVQGFEEVVVGGGDDDAEPGHVAQPAGQRLGDARRGDAVEGSEELVEDERDGLVGADRGAEGVQERPCEHDAGTLTDRERGEGLEEQMTFCEAAERKFADPLEQGAAGGEVDDAAAVVGGGEGRRGDGAAAEKGGEERGFAGTAGAGDEGEGGVWELREELIGGATGGGRASGVLGAG